MGDEDDEVVDEVVDGWLRDGWSVEEEEEEDEEEEEEEGRMGWVDSPITRPAKDLIEINKDHSKDFINQHLYLIVGRDDS